MRGNGVGRRALEHVQLVRLLGDDRYRLDRRGPGADHADSLAGEVDTFVRPPACVIRLAPGRCPCPRMSGMFVDDRHPVAMIEELRRHVVAAVGVHQSSAGVLVERRALMTLRVELHVASQFEAVRYVVGVLQDLGLGRVALGPLPLLLEPIGEAVGVLHALDVAARPGVAVPVPGAPYVARRPRRPASSDPGHAAVEHVHTGESGADDHGVETGVVGRFVHDRASSSTPRSSRASSCQR